MRCATRLPATGSRMRSCLPASAAPARRRPRASWRGRSTASTGRPSAVSATRASRSRKAATWTCSRSMPPATPASTTSAKSSSRAVDRGPRPLQDLHHRRGAPAVGAVVQRAAQVDRRAARHVLFIMATTELHKIPDTILSRSQVFEFRAFPTRSSPTIKRMVKEEGIDVPDAALALIAPRRRRQHARRAERARSGDGLCRSDDHRRRRGHRARAGGTRSAVRRDRGGDCRRRPARFALTDRAVESGHDLRLIIRELTKVVRDMMMVVVDPSRAGGRSGRR